MKWRLGSQVVPICHPVTDLAFGWTDLKACDGDEGVWFENLRVSSFRR